MTPPGGEALLRLETPERAGDSGHDDHWARSQVERGSEGLTSLRESALKKVFSGVSTLHEINRVTFVEELNLNDRP
jgi:type II secretory ATPase GspE/PulE/Tfp pilus assembly ATPase PilB-like protein